MPLFAESIDGALTLIFGVPIVVGAITLLSFWPSFRGHWSGPLLALPAVLVGLLAAYSLLTAQRKDQLMPGLWPWAIVPLVLGAASVCLWLFRRSRQE
jgi:hypothetical protein